MEDIATWIESHPATVDLAKAILLVLIAWVSGAFALLARFRRKPILEIANTASFVYVEHIKEHQDKRNLALAAFIVNASVVNASNEKIVVDTFLLSFRTHSVWRSHSQKLLHIAFPSRPRKRLGNGVKPLSVWFTKFLEEEIDMGLVTGELEPKQLCGGYLLFSSFTYGNWNPKIKNGKVHIRLKVKLTSQKWLKMSMQLRAMDDRDHIEEMSPGIIDHIKHESTWNHDLSVLGK